MLPLTRHYFEAMLLIATFKSNSPANFLPNLQSTYLVHIPQTSTLLSLYSYTVKWVLGGGKFAPETKANLTSPVPQIFPPIDCVNMYAMFALRFIGNILLSSSAFLSLSVH